MVIPNARAIGLHAGVRNDKTRRLNFTHRIVADTVRIAVMRYRKMSSMSVAVGGKKRGRASAAAEA
jgi:hypothetical protein